MAAAPSWLEHVTEYGLPQLLYSALVPHGCISCHLSDSERGCLTGLFQTASTSGELAS